MYISLRKWRNERRISRLDLAGDKSKLMVLRNLVRIKEEGFRSVVFTSRTLKIKNNKTTKGTQILAL